MIFEYIAEHEMFEMRYRCLLASRYLRDLVANDAAEKQMVAKLQVRCVHYRLIHIIIIIIIIIIKDKFARATNALCRQRWQYFYVTVYVSIAIAIFYIFLPFYYCTSLRSDSF